MKLYIKVLYISPKCVKGFFCPWLQGEFTRKSEIKQGSSCITESHKVPWVEFTHFTSHWQPQLRPMFAPGGDCHYLDLGSQYTVYVYRPLRN